MSLVEIKRIMDTLSDKFKEYSQSIYHSKAKHSGLKVINVFMLNSAEHEIEPAYKC